MLALASLTLLACAHAQEKTFEPPRPTPVERVARTTVPSPSTGFDAVMSQHFGHASAARDAIVRGDETGARKALLELASDPSLGSVPGAWLPRVRALQADARAAAGREDFAGLADGVANLARACGDCHEATGGGVATAILEAAPSERADTLADRMVRHERAAEQLWLGLIAPADASWKAGANTLATAPFEIEVHGDPPAHLAQALHHVRFLGSTAERTQSRPDRARVYAHLLRTCADCHRATHGARN